MKVCTEETAKVENEVVNEENHLSLLNRPAKRSKKRNQFSEEKKD